MDLHLSLAESAERYAKRALAAFVNEEDAEFALCAGIAVELAMKARLARENPVFVAPERNFPAVVALVRLGADVEKLPMGTHTATARQALERVEYLDPSFSAHSAGVRNLLLHRNGEAHLGLVDATRRRALGVSFFRAINGLLRVKADVFWAPHDRLVTALLDQEAETLKQAVEIKLAAARVRYEHLVGLVHFDAVEASAQVAAVALASDTSLVEQCPVCSEETAIAVGDNHEEVESDGGDWASWSVCLWTSSFRCLMCGLSLESPEEIQAAGLPEALDNPHADLADLWEPDEDVARGR